LWDDHATLYNIYLGHDLRLVPTTFTFGIELNGENDEVALTPQIRKGLSRTGALAAAIGVRLPLNKRDEQGVQWAGYLLWEYLEPVFSRPQPRRRRSLSVRSPTRDRALAARSSALRRRRRRPYRRSG